MKMSVRNSHNKSIGSIPESQLQQLKQNNFISSSLDYRQPQNYKDVQFDSKKRKQNSSSADLLQTNNLNIEGMRHSMPTQTKTTDSHKMMHTESNQPTAQQHQQVDSFKFVRQATKNKH